MLFHKHNFKKEGSVLYCECGKLMCIHEWLEVERRTVKDVSFGLCQWSHDVVVLRCKNCGEYKNHIIK